MTFLGEHKSRSGGFFKFMGTALIIIALVGFVMIGISTLEINCLEEDFPHFSDMLGEISTEPVVPDEVYITAAGYDYGTAIEMIEALPGYHASSTLQNLVLEYKKLDSTLVTYTDMSNITHIFFHSLIVDPQRAFDNDADHNGYNLYMTTITEFKAILQSMYDKGYVLVSPYDVAHITQGEDGSQFTYGEIRLPEGRIPFLMSQDDLNYYGYMIGDEDPNYQKPAFPQTNGDGFAHKLIVDKNGSLTCEYMDADGTITTGSYDLVPVLEDFIREHPDFSYHGARAILGITGYEGVFGYRTKPAYRDALGDAAYEAEVAAAKNIAQALKDHGYIIASHSYGHMAYGSYSASRVEKDSDRWEKTVEPIVGDTDILLYPFGSDIAGVERYSFSNEKFKALYEDGYRYFFNVDGHYAWCQLGKTYFRGGRRNLDGYRMYHNPEMLDDLFNAYEVLDIQRPLPVPSL
jgi:hypothetical protein